MIIIILWNYTFAMFRSWRRSGICTNSLLFNLNCRINCAVLAVWLFLLAFANRFTLKIFRFRYLSDLLAFLSTQYSFFMTPQSVHTNIKCGFLLERKYTMFMPKSIYKFQQKSILTENVWILVFMHQISNKMFIVNLFRFSCEKNKINK